MKIGNPAAHSLGVHCAQVIGWHPHFWCADCQSHWQQHSGMREYDPSYHARVEQELIRSVLESVASGRSPLPPGFKASSLAEIHLPF